MNDKIMRCEQLELHFNFNSHCRADENLQWQRMVSRGLWGTPAAISSRNCFYLDGVALFNLMCPQRDMRHAYFIRF